MNVAVVSTCYNQGHLIGDAIQSVIDQETDATVVHIVVDDGSTDDSVDRIQQWEKNSKVGLLSVTNRGFPAALNAGLLAVPSSCRHVVTLPGDDYLPPNYVEECLAVAAEAEVVVTGMRRVGYPGGGDVEFPTVFHPSLETLWEWEQTYAWSVAMFRRSALVETGGFHPLMAGDCDWDMLVDLRARGGRFAYTDRTFYFYRYDPGSLNRQKTKAEWDRARTEMMRHHRRSTLPGPEFS